jgi:hypothetical protein
MPHAFNPHPDHPAVDRDLARAPTGTPEFDQSRDELHARPCSADRRVMFFPQLWRDHVDRYLETIGAMLTRP